MTDITNITASQRILAHLHEGRLVQGTWHQKQDGLELACLIGAISPEISSDTQCPASVMPSWLAVLTVPVFDGQAKDVALAWAGRFGAQMAQWHRLDDASWFRVWESFCSACVADGRRSAASAASAAASASAYAAAAAASSAYAAAAAAAAASAYASAYAAVAVAVAAAAAADAAAAAAAAYPVAKAARQACWARLATALCDLIDAELAASAAKGTL
jgi:hypothetical protein